MIANLKPHPSYKRSEVESLGPVPAHWTVRRLAQFGKLSRGSGGNKDDEVAMGIPCIRYGDLYTLHHTFIRMTRSFIPKDKAAEYSTTKFGDVLFASSGETIDEIGKSAVNLMQHEACCGGDVIVFRPSHRVDARYLGYATDCVPATTQKATMGRGITVMHIYAAQLKHLAIPFPPLVEQGAIVRFLDHADRSIRRYIRGKQKLIALLDEQKQALIKQAVGGQIDAFTGRPHAAYRPSGVEWLGRVPAHWNVRRVKQVSHVQGGFAFPSSSFGNEGIPVVRMSDIERGVLCLDSAVRIPEHGCKDDYALKEGDILYGLSGSIGATGSLGNYAIVKRESVPAQLNQRVARFRPRTVQLSDTFLVYVLQTKSFYTQVLSYTSGTAQFNVSTGDIGNIFIALPPINEQQQIVRRLRSTAAKIDADIRRARREIDLLREYRTRLVADVVTGKVDVRESATSLPAADSSGPEDDLDGALDTAADKDIHELDHNR